MDAYKKCSEEELIAMSKVMPPTLGGMEQSKGLLQWIWENFAAVAGDQPSFECWRTYFQRLERDKAVLTYSSKPEELVDARGIARRLGMPNR